MGQADEEIYVTLVVVRRPPGSGRPDVDPAHWTEWILNGLVPTGADHRAEVLTRRFTSRAASPWLGTRAGTGFQPNAFGLGRSPRKQQRPWAYLALGTICLGAAIYLAQLLLT